MAQQPWLLGRHLSFYIEGYDTDTNGNYITRYNQTTLQSGRDASGVLERAALRIRNTVEEVSPMAMIGENNVVVKKGGTLELSQLLHQVGTWNVLADVAARCQFAKVIITRGQRTWTFFGAIEGYEETYERGKTLGTMTLSVSGSAPPVLS